MCYYNTTNIMKYFTCFTSALFDIFLIFVLLFRCTSQYRHMIIEDDHLCSQVKTRKIILDKYDKSALIVTQTRLNDHSLDWNHAYTCKFKVETAHSDDGLFAVIQRLAFRRNETTGRCIDYIQFKGKHGLQTSPKFCGAFNAALKMDHNFIGNDAVVTWGNSFIEQKNVMEVQIYVAKEPLGIDEEMDLNVVFTTYQDCNKEKSKSRLRHCHPDFCIDKAFFNDGVVNCPFVDCVDEDGCSRDHKDVAKQSQGNKVLIGSLSTLCIIFVIFIVCLWAFKKHRVLCWAENFANPTNSNTPQQTNTRVMEMNQQTGSRLSQHVTMNMPSAPPTVDDDKDLPPSYDSLFPDR